IYALGGLGSTGLLDTVEVSTSGSLPSGTWQTGKSMDVGREAAAAAAGFDGKIYVLGGFRDGVAQAIVEVYDPSLSQWPSIAHMPTRRWGHAAVTGPDGRIYALGGVHEVSGALDAVEASD